MKSLLIGRAAYLSFLWETAISVATITVFKVADQRTRERILGRLPFERDRKTGAF